MNNRLKKITLKNYILLAIKETNKKFIKNLRGSVIFKVQSNFKTVIATMQIQ